MVSTHTNRTPPHHQWDCGSLVRLSKLRLVCGLASFVLSVPSGVPNTDRAPSRCFNTGKVRNVGFVFTTSFEGNTSIDYYYYCNYYYFCYYYYYHHHHDYYYYYDYDYYYYYLSLLLQYYYYYYTGYFCFHSVSQALFNNCF